VRVEEPSLPSNFAEMTFNFTVRQAAYFEQFDGACPAGWTLAGDWQCGTPTNVGPPTAHSGAHCIATKIAGPYSYNQSWTVATATSPPIDLTATTSPTLEFWTWLDTEGQTYDGFNLKISTDGGATYSLLNTVTPAYFLTIAGEPAWGGDWSYLGW